ncbi:MAG TPA: class I SAM-dependent methyltransferase [Thermoleophilaceae bacterium]|jgi:2-polyprenyl-3-methyl-5-hydroxy-6-metoxy-1,4-benzoquinol methylase
MTQPESALSLRAKPAGYYGSDRRDVIGELEPPLGRVLDVGCGEGGAADMLREAGADWISGIEIMPEPAAVAATRYDEVEVGDALEAVERVSGPFDTVLCYDVLEHLVDPAALLRRLLTVARAGGRLHVSVPNARHFSLVRDLVLRGTFGYSEYGHRDATHLRWFTRADMLELLGAAGWTVESSTPGAIHKIRSLRLPLPRRLIYGLGGEFLTQQWYVLARAPAAG